MEYGLIGEKLGHSASKEIHEQLADYSYELHPLTKEDFPIFMEEKAFRALNVTIPYKQAVIPYLTAMDENAKAIGAVNTIVNQNGSLYGYNKMVSTWKGKKLLSLEMVVPLRQFRQVSKK